MESDHSNDSEQDGDHEHDELHKFKWRLGLGRSDCLQSWHFFKQLHDQNEQIEVETDHGADRVNPAPCSGEMPAIPRENGDREKWQRDNSKTDGWSETVKWKEESGERCQNGHGQKPFRPAIEPVAGNHSKQNNDSGKNRDQADERVNNGVDVQNHLLALHLHERGRLGCAHCCFHHIKRY